MKYDWDSNLIEVRRIEKELFYLLNKEAAGEATDQEKRRCRSLGAKYVPFSAIDSKQ